MKSSLDNDSLTAEQTTLEQKTAEICQELKRITKPLGLTEWTYNQFSKSATAYTSHSPENLRLLQAYLNLKELHTILGRSPSMYMVRIVNLNAESDLEKLKKIDAYSLSSTIINKM